MSGIGRIGTMGGVSRDAASAGHDGVAKEMERQLDQLETHDINGRKLGKAGATPEKNKKVDEVAKLYEKQFLGEMMKAMRGTVSFSDASKPSMAENIYREQLDSQYVDSWGENGGIGLSNLIYDQMMERYFTPAASQGLRKQGTIKLSDHDVSHVSRVANGVENSQQIPLKVELKPTSVPDAGESATRPMPVQPEEPSSATSTHDQAGAGRKGTGFQKPMQNQTPMQIQAPWSGEVVSKMSIDGKTAVTLQHDDGVRSTFIFDGVASPAMEPGRGFAYKNNTEADERTGAGIKSAKIAKGDVIGTLSPEINSFFWNLHRRA